MRTVELLPDDRLECGVRELWSRLHREGLPSLAAHPHPTNRPHLTLLRARSLAGLPPLRLPVAVTLGPARMLGRAFVRLVEPTAELRELHARAYAALAHADPWPPPCDFVPHVSLALRARAPLWEPLPAQQGNLVAARSYDSETRTVTVL